MEKIKEKIKTLNEELSVARKEMNIIDDKICTIECELKKYNTLVYIRQNELLNKLLHVSIFNKFSYNFKYQHTNFSWMSFLFKNKWFTIDNNSRVTCNGAAGKYSANNLKYKDTVLDIPEVQEFIEYVIANFKIVYNKIEDLKKQIVHGHLYGNYELAVTFLLCRPPFPKDISKLIANKILFFSFYFFLLFFLTIKTIKN